MNPIQSALLLAAIALTWGCETHERIVYRDRPVEFDRSDDGPVIDGDPEVILGLFEEQLFAELEDGDPVPIVYGLQGGTWLHVSIRVVGIAPEGEVSASLGDLSTIGYPLELVRTVEGFFEAYDVPIPVEPPDGMVLEDLFGRRYPLTISYTADEVSASTVVEIELIDG